MSSRKAVNFHTIKRIFSPPLLGFLLGILLVIANINLPDFIDATFSYLGALTTPLSMFFIGISISFFKISKFPFSLDKLVIVLGRFLIVPLIVYVVISLFRFPAIIKNVFILESAMPIITQVAIVSKFYGIESNYTSELVSLTTTLSLFIIPIYALILK